MRSMLPTLSVFRSAFTLEDINAVIQSDRGVSYWITLWLILVSLYRALILCVCVGVCLQLHITNCHRPASEPYAWVND